MLLRTSDGTIYLATGMGVHAIKGIPGPDGKMVGAMRQFRALEKVFGPPRPAEFLDVYLLQATLNAIRDRR